VVIYYFISSGEKRGEKIIIMYKMNTALEVANFLTGHKKSLNQEEWRRIHGKNLIKDSMFCEGNVSISNDSSSDFQEVLDSEPFITDYFFCT
jgi:hypothetical protein